MALSPLRSVAPGSAGLKLVSGDDKCFVTRNCITRPSTSGSSMVPPLGKGAGESLFKVRVLPSKPEKSMIISMRSPGAMKRHDSVKTGPKLGSFGGQRLEGLYVNGTKLEML